MDFLQDLVLKTTKNLAENGILAQEAAKIIQRTEFLPKNRRKSCEAMLMTAKTLQILNLYPRQMNIYGDHGNLLVLQRRAQWRGIDVQTINFNPGDEFPGANLAADKGDTPSNVQDTISGATSGATFDTTSGATSGKNSDAITGAEPITLPTTPQIDIILGGGGQDSGQAVIQRDLQRISGWLHKLVERGVPALVVCGTYQLFGNYFKTFEGDIIEGIGIFNAHTVGGSERMIGNIITSNSNFGELIGYENHSGQTYLGTGQEPLAQVVSGCGNNGTDKTEGARYKNALGTYLHGPLLPKNPQIADFLLGTALLNKYGENSEFDFAKRWSKSQAQDGSKVDDLNSDIDDSLVSPARKAAKDRPR